MSRFDQTITYDRNTPIGTVYYDQSFFVQLNKYFDDVKLVSPAEDAWLADFALQDRHVGVDVDATLLPYGVTLSSSPEFAEIAKTMPRRKFLLYKPLDPPYPINPLVYIMNSPTIAHAYEHKRYFRDEFADLINLPEYVVRRLDDLDENAYHELESMFGKMVLQEVESSGSKGTFIVDTPTKFLAAVQNLKKISYSGTVVISKFIEGTPYSVQVCVTKYGIFTGGLQKQLVDSAYLCNTELPEVSKWCGGELGGNQPEILKHRTQEIATIVGSELASHGYRGIFGIDLIITPQDEVYAIEINARLTGYTSVLSDMQYAKDKIPFMLLHALELGNFKYEVEDSDALPTMSSLDETHSYLILNNQLEEQQTLQATIKNGIYKFENGQLTYAKASYSVEDLSDEQHVIIMSRFKKGDVMRRGARMMHLIKKGVVMDIETQDLNRETQELVKSVKRHFAIQDQEAQKA